MVRIGPARGEPSAPLARIVAGALIGLVVAVAAARWAVHLATDLPRLLTSAAADPADVVLRILAVAALAIGTWLAGTTALAYLVELPALAGSRVSRAVAAWTPRLARRIVGATLGGALLGLGTTTAALAEPTPPPSPTVATTVQTPGAGTSIAPDPSFVPLDSAPSPSSAPTTGPSTSATGTPSPPAAPPSATPEAPSPTAQPSSAPASPGAPHTGTGGSTGPDPGVIGHRPARGGAHQPRTVTVHRGDTLWGIAAAHLGPHASEADIAREWPRWYAANRAVIGDDPDLILAGQILVVPTDTAATPEGR